MSILWYMRLLIAALAGAALFCTCLTGCEAPQVRVKCVHLAEPVEDTTADVAVRWKSRELVFSVEVENVQDERPEPSGEPTATSAGAP